MDKISQLPDELLLKVLLFLPTKVAVSTSILSKRWEFLWLWLPKLEYDDSESSSLRNFISFNMPLHKAPVIESLRLNFSYESIEPEDIRMWIVIAVPRCIRELSVKLASCSSSRRATLPTSLYTCKSLVILELKEVNVVDVPRMACLPSLKTLLLQDVVYEDDKSFQQLLASCPVLEDLFVERDAFVGTLSVNVPSLQRLTLKICRGDNSEGLMINTPLKYFNVMEYDNDNDNDNDNDSDNDNGSYYFYCEAMPKLEEVEVDTTYPNIDIFISSITHVKRLSLCVYVQAEEALYLGGIVFHQLQHLKICSCSPNWPQVLFRLLKDSPSLRELEVYHRKDEHTHCNADPWVCWQSQLDCVPLCLLSSLETFKWTGRCRSQKEIDLLKYILRNARCLKAATFLFSPSYTLEEKDKLETVKQDLSLSFRGSETCHLVLI